MSGKRLPAIGVIVGSVDAFRRSEAFVAVLAAISAFVFLSAIPASVGLRRTLVGAAALGNATTLSATMSLTARRAVDRAPVAGAAARIFWEQGGKYYFAGAGMTDAAGRLELSSLPAGASWLLVDAKDMARSSTALTLGTSKSSMDVLLEPARTL